MNLKDFGTGLILFGIFISIVNFFYAHKKAKQKAKAIATVKRISYTSKLWRFMKFVVLFLNVIILVFLVLKIFRGNIDTDALMVITQGFFWLTFMFVFMPDNYCISDIGIITKNALGMPISTIEWEKIRKCYWLDYKPNHLYLAMQNSSLRIRVYQDHVNEVKMILQNRVVRV